MQGGKRNKHNNNHQKEESKQNQNGKGQNEKKDKGQNEKKDKKNDAAEFDKKLLEQMVKFSEYTEFSEAAVAINEALKKFHGKNINAIKKTLNHYIKDQIKNGSGEGILAVPKDAAMSKEDHVTSSLVLALIELGQEDCQLNKSFNFLQVYYDILGKS